MLVPESLKECTRKVLEGEYDIPELKLEAPVILDIGANVGAFAVWAKSRWPGATIHCYEPNEKSFELLEGNADFAVLNNVAVWSHSGTKFLFNGYSNPGEASLFHDWRNQDEGSEVICISADLLPPADVLKIDTEGAESIILKGYKYIDGVQAVMLEWHSLYDRYHLGSMLMDHGFGCVTDAA